MPGTEELHHSLSCPLCMSPGTAGQGGCDRDRQWVTTCRPRTVLTKRLLGWPSTGKAANPHLGDASGQGRASAVGCQQWLWFACLPGLLQHRTPPMQVLSFSLSKCHKTEVLRILLGMFSFCPHTLCTRHRTI